MTNQQTYPHSSADPPERVTSDPVPVPPPADRDDAAEDVTDRVPEDALDDRGTFEDPALAGERNDPDDLTAVTQGEPDYHEPPPQQTAFGAATVAGAAAAAAQAGPSREVRDRDEAVAEGAVGDTDQDLGTRAEADRRPDLDAAGTTDLNTDRADLDRTDTDRLDAAGTTDPDTDRADTDRSDAAGTTDLNTDRADLDRTDTGRADMDADAERPAADRVDADRADLDEGDRAAGEPIDAEQPLGGGPTDLPETAPAVDEPAEPATAPAVEEPIAGLWGEGTAQGYRDRWREVQLRFVDDPPGAAREANQLVEEAVGALTAELARQKETLSGWSGEDTEELRAVVRRHRDFLDRLLGL